jgi:hypothetical protein
MSATRPHSKLADSVIKTLALQKKQDVVAVSVSDTGIPWASAF